MEYILKRLLSAASNPEVRQDMNVEDEFFKAIEDRDTAIMQRDRIIEKQDKKLYEQGKMLDEQGKMLNEQGKMLAAAVKGLHANGMAVKTIANMLNQPEEKIKDILKE